MGTLAAAVLGSVDYRNADGLAIGDVSGTTGIATGNTVTNGGSVTVNAGGLLTVAEPINTSSGSGGELRVGSGVSLNAGLTLGAGNITLNGGGTACHILINAAQNLAGNAYFQATCDVVVNASVTTTAGGNVELSGDYSTPDGSGGVLVTTLGSLDVAGDLLAAGSALTVANGGTYTGNSVAVADNVGATPDVKAAGNIQIGDGSGALAGADTVINGQVQTTVALKTITVTGEQDVRFGAGASLTGVSGKVTVTADTGTGNDGVLFMANGAVINAGSGDIDLDAAGNITLGSIQTISTSATAVTIDTGAAVVDGGDAGVDIVANSGTVVINAVSGVGHGNALETTIGTIDVDNATSGNIEIAETDGITINKLAQATAGNISLISSTGTVTVAASQSGVSVVGNGTILLWADGGDAGDMVVNDTVTSASGSITLRADDDVTFGVEGDVTSVSGSIEVTADFDNGGASSGALTMSDSGSDSTVINAGSGTIDLNADENIALGSVQTTSSSATAVTIDTTEGAVTDAGDTAVDIIAINGTVVIHAVTGIGHGNDIETSIHTLAATNSTSGDIVVQETNGLIVGGTGVQTLAGNGNINIDVDAGGLTVDSVVTAHGDGNITLNVDDGRGEPERHGQFRPAARLALPPTAWRRMIRPARRSATSAPATWALSSGPSR